MSMPDNNLDDRPVHDGPSPESRRGSGGTVAAWAVILAVTVMVASAHMLQPRRPTENGRLHGAVATFQTRYLVGAASVLGERAAEPLERQVKQWQPDAPETQLRAAVTAGELIGPEAALERLRAIDHQPQADGTPHEFAAPREVLVRLYEDYAEDRIDGPSASPAQRQQLRERLGWLGDLALAPPGSDTALREQVLAAARRTFFFVVGGVVALAVLGLVGVVVLVVFLAYLFANVLPGLRPAPERSGIYAEAFAWWLVAFVGLSIAGGWVFGPDALGATGFLAMIGSLAALAWPRMRGIPWEHVRDDVGWTTGRGAGVELLAAVGCYAMAIPLVVLALILTGAIIGGWAHQGFGTLATATHPAAEWLVEGTWWQRVQVLLLACVIAPIVEEVAFRGLLYRHLRDATRTMRRGSSVLLSAAVSSVLFALLHPQGLLAVPALTAIALALTFTREWRNTLVPSIVAHGLNNAVVMAVLLTILAK